MWGRLIYKIERRKETMKQKYLLIILSFLLLNLCPLCGIKVYAEEGIRIDETNFPDSIFRTNISNADKDKNGILSKEEIEGITVIYFDGGDYTGYQKLQSLKGIEFLTNLKTLYLNSTGVKSIDLNKNSNLVKIKVTNQIIQEFKLPESSKLSILETFNSQFPSIDFSGQPELKQVSLSVRGETIDFSKNRKLESVMLTGMVTEGSIVSKCTKHISQVKTVIIGDNDKIKSLKCDLPKLSKLDIGKTPALNYVSINNSKRLKSLNTDKMTNLKQLEVVNCGLTRLKLTKNKKLEKLNCSKNKLKKLSVTKNIKLKLLKCSNNKISILNLKKNKNLKTLSCKKNKIRKIDIQKTKLKRKNIKCDKKVIIIK